MNISTIIDNIKSVFHCPAEEILDLRRLNGGLTNVSYIFSLGGVDYIYRSPGKGTEKIISRPHERVSLEKAKMLNLDPTYIYMDTEKGWKISRRVMEFREPDYSDFEDSKKVIAVMRQLHDSHVEVDYGLRPWEDSVEIEKILKSGDPNCFNNFESLKKKVRELYENTIGDGVQKCFCHGDTYKYNWLVEPDGHVILIDWEYSGMSDPGIDVGYYIVDAMYEVDEAKRFIREYLGDSYSSKLEYHYLAYTAIIAYYWFVWALYRESCGADMGEAVFNWYSMAKRYSKYLTTKV